MIALIIAIVLVTGRVKVSGDEGQCTDMGYARVACPSTKPYFNTITKSCVTASNNRRRAVVDLPTPNCTVTSNITNIQAQCADAVNRYTSLVSLAGSASCDVTRMGNLRDRIVALTSTFPTCGTPGTCRTPLLTGLPGAPGSAGLPGRISTWEGPRGPRGVPGRTPTFAGVMGPTGPAGPIGPTGARGQDSAVVGFPGMPGNAGADGRPGPTGPAGSQGPVGPASSQAGPPGQPGAPGPAGSPSYTAGPPGIAGVDGSEGLDSNLPGFVGPVGPTGSSGTDSTITGPPGPPGVDGTNGVDGSPGNQGPTGPAGSVLSGQPACPKGDPGAASVVIGPAGPAGDNGVPGLSGNASLVQIVDILTGSMLHTIALMSDGRVFGWGDNGLGQIGLGNTNAVRRPSLILLPAPVVAMSANRYTTCYVLNTTRIMCTGYNNVGQLGQGTTALYYPNGQTLGTVTYSVVPVEVGGNSPLTGFTSVVVGGDENYGHVCAIRAGLVFCWGFGAYGQLGEDPATLGGSAASQFRSTPKQVPNLPPGIVALYTGRGSYQGTSDYHPVYARTADGTLYSWGPANGYMLGRDISMSSPSSFASFQAAVVQRFRFDTVGLSGIVDMQINGHEGYGTFIALHSNGTVFGWGHNNYGQVGVGQNGGTVNYPQPIRFPANFLARKISGAQGGWASSFCAIHLTDTSVYCWGNNWQGQVGVTSTGAGTPCSGSQTLNSISYYIGSGITSSCNVPTRVNGPTNSNLDFSWNVGIVDLATAGTNWYGVSGAYINWNYNQACALRNDGTVWCWGYNGGGLGDGTGTTRSYASRVSNLRNIRAIFSQVFTSNGGGGISASVFAIEQTNTTLWSWGGNPRYNLGVYQTDTFYTPVATQNLRFTAN